MADAARFIQRNLHLSPMPAVPEIRLFRAHPASGLSRLVGEDGPSPYWAYGWAGGTVLARYVLDHPQSVRGQKALDLGSGSGVVAIAAAMAGASMVLAADIDPLALTASRLNAEANGVVVEVVELVSSPPEVDIVLAGDVFYAEDVAARSLAFLDMCLVAGIEVLVGDPGRAFLPLHRLEVVATYEVPDFGSAELGPAAVYKFR
ncbi:MAG: 50S ribosomal protein L11 methyltransferase [Asticcacaulis sp.]